MRVITYEESLATLLFDCFVQGETVAQIAEARGLEEAAVKHYIRAGLELGL